jgi:hypothetical protein
MAQNNQEIAELGIPAGEFGKQIFFPWDFYMISIIQYFLIQKRCVEALWFVVFAWVCCHDIQVRLQIADTFIAKLAFPQIFDTVETHAPSVEEEFPELSVHTLRWIKSLLL